MCWQPPVAVLERMLTVRLHLDDCDLGNGPLHVIPGSHKSGRLSAAAISDWRERLAFVPCTIPRGGVLLMRPLLLHASSPALEPRCATAGSCTWNLQLTRSPEV